MSATDSSRLQTIQVPQSDIGLQFSTLLESKEGADVVFNVAGERFPAHKLVLAARSPVFQTKFFGGVEDESDEIFVDDLEPEVFKVCFFLLVFVNIDNVCSKSLRMC